MAAGLLVAATALAGVVSTALVRRDAEHREREVRDRAADVAANALTQVAAHIVSELRGASGLVDPNGEVAASSFRSLATDVVNGSVFDSVAHEMRVDAHERTSFESRYVTIAVEQRLRASSKRAR
jgi:hypothetical protein